MIDQHEDSPSPVIEEEDCSSPQTDKSPQNGVNSTEVFKSTFKKWFTRKSKSSSKSKTPKAKPVEEKLEDEEDDFDNMELSAAEAFVKRMLLVYDEKNYDWPVRTRAF